jgi:hypothetical protein
MILNSMKLTKIEKNLEKNVVNHQFRFKFEFLFTNENELRMN